MPHAPALDAQDQVPCDPDPEAVQVQLRRAPVSSHDWQVVS
jgi:hypothetical protein